MAANVLFSIIVGVVQGVSEWLPISSKTQVLLVSTFLFGLPTAVGFAFGLFMQLGSLTAAVVYLRKEVVSVFSDKKLFVYLLVVTTVTAVVGVPLYLITEKLLQGTYNVGAPMILLGAFLLADGLYIRRAHRKPRITGLNEMGMKQYLILGFAQGLSALPGVSRSGMTVSTMLFLGVEPESALRLSFLAYIPASLGAFITSVVFSRTELHAAVGAIDLTGVAIAMTTAAVVGFATISGLLRFARQSEMYAITIVLGIVALVVGLVVATGSVPAGPETLILPLPVFASHF